jgi:hypothetical protein
MRRSPTRLHRELGGASTLSIVLLMPLFLTVALVQQQTALHGHARAEAGLVANETASLVGHIGIPATLAKEQAERILREQTDLTEVVVEITQRQIGSGIRVVVVDVTARSPGVVPGTTIDVVVRGVAVMGRNTFEPS